MQTIWFQKCNFPSFVASVLAYMHIIVYMSFDLPERNGESKVICKESLGMRLDFMFGGGRVEEKDEGV